MKFNIQITFFALILVLLSCSKEGNDPCDNGTSVFYWSDQVCGEEGTAAISFDGGTEGLLILNFSDFIDPSSLQMGNELSIVYDPSEVDSSALLSGLLCGPLIILPSVSVSCLELE